MDLRVSGDRVLRDDAWLNWRFADAPREYQLLHGDGYAAVGRRGRAGVIAALDGNMLGDACAVAAGPAVIAAPPPWDARGYAFGGFVPTTKTFTVLGKSLGHPMPERPHFELGDLDFL
jgi:hypothetical protein